VELITDHERTQLVKNYQLRRDGKVTDPGDFIPVVCAQTGDGNKIWMLTELSDQNSDEAYGLITDYAVGSQIGPVSLREMVMTRDRSGLGVIKSTPFHPKHDLKSYQKIQQILVDR